MSRVRIALANLRFPESREDSVLMAKDAITDAGAERAAIVCFPECFVPGYRVAGKAIPPPDAAFQEHAWAEIGATAAGAGIAVILGTERMESDALYIMALVFNSDGTRAGFQDKVQLDPSEDGIYTPGFGRRIFRMGELTFGIVICHEGWRYPETVRWAARRGAQVVFHPHYHWAEPGGYVPFTFADPQNTFHEKAMLCRAAENTCYFASVNCAEKDSPTTSAVIRPDGTLLKCQAYGKKGLLLAEIDTAEATGLLAKRWKPEPDAL
jgi:predicted amidohydrolase